MRISHSSASCSLTLSTAQLRHQLSRDDSSPPCPGSFHWGCLSPRTVTWSLQFVLLVLWDMPTSPEDKGLRSGRGYTKEVSRQKCLREDKSTEVNHDASAREEAAISSSRQEVEFPPQVSVAQELCSHHPQG